MTTHGAASARLRTITAAAEAQCRRSAAAQSRFHRHSPQQAAEEVQAFIANRQVDVPLADLLAALARPFVVTAEAAE